MEENYNEDFNEEADNYETSDESVDNESKADKFKRLASKRTNNAIKQIENIGKLSTSAYEYTLEQVERIFGALQDTLDTAKAKFNKTKATKQKFTL